jgi:transposase
LSWPSPDGVTDTELEARLFASAGAGLGTRRGHRRQAEPDWAAVHRELRRKHVTLSILWEEYIAGEPGGYRYSRFCELYRAWESHRADFRRGARRIELHLRAGDLDVSRRSAACRRCWYASPDAPPVVSDEVAASVLPRAGAV